MTKTSKISAALADGEDVYILWQHFIDAKKVIYQGQGLFCGKNLVFFPSYPESDQFHLSASSTEVCLAELGTKTVSRGELLAYLH